MVMRRPACLASVLFLYPVAASAQMEGASVTAPTVEIELREGDQLIGSPVLRLQVGRPAAVSVGSYSLRVRLARAESDGQGPYVLRSSLYRSASGWALVASPVMNIARGEQNRLDFADSDGRALSMAVTLHTP
jgi:hypothetical protein